jgi:hypothetical protein
MIGIGFKICQLPANSVLRSNDTTDCKPQIQGLEMDSVSLSFPVDFPGPARRYKISPSRLEGRLTIAITIVISSHPKARTTRVRTKIRRQTLTSEMAKKTEVTMRMALLRESSLTAARMAASAASLRLSASMTTVWSHPPRGARWEIRVIEEWRREGKGRGDRDGVLVVLFS